uniref:Dihydrolipoyllysine-residue succinyltransferase component of 2-oxoglutarate dehydrogenase complex, mitochondrial n=1 Tax=Fundulus heteroclitus TaxID=8078 RepID=A0A3Q2PR58_FUNHE
MLSHSRCLTRNFGRSLSVIRQAPKVEAPAVAAPPPPSAAPTPPPSSTVGPIPTTLPPVPPVPAHAMDTKPSAIKPTAAPAAPAAHAEGGAKSARTESRNITEMRKAYKDAFLKKHNIKLGFMSAFVKAAAHALVDQPAVNAVIDDTTKEIVYREYVDISVAVATPKGLVVPVIRNVEEMNFADIEKAINLLGEKARKNELAVEDMDGGTFTISNGGVFGSMFGTPIINPPQSAILGMHGIFDRPVAIGGKVKMNRMRLRIAQRLKEAQNTCAMLTTFNEVDMVEIRPMMYVALTYDHRLVDGREAVTFLRKIKSVVEDPRVLLLDM